MTSRARATAYVHGAPAASGTSRACAHKVTRTPHAVSGAHFFRTRFLSSAQMRTPQARCALVTLCRNHLFGSDSTQRAGDVQWLALRRDEEAELVSSWGCVARNDKLSICGEEVEAASISVCGVDPVLHSPPSLAPSLLPPSPPSPPSPPLPTLPHPPTPSLGHTLAITTPYFSTPIFQSRLISRRDFIAFAPHSLHQQVTPATPSPTLSPISTPRSSPFRYPPFFCGGDTKKVFTRHG